MEVNTFCPDIKEFCPDIKHIKGEENIVAYAISRLPIANNDQKEQCTDAQDQLRKTITEGKILPLSIVQSTTKSVLETTFTLQQQSTATIPQLATSTKCNCTKSRRGTQWRTYPR
jgi:hypothetical protein